jgi:hypothetical protein
MILERFRAKWTPVRMKKTRQNKGLEQLKDPIGSEIALEPDDFRWDHNVNPI